MQKSATLWLALGILCPLSSLAIGLSDIHIHSALNQPFAAEIDVLGLRDMPLGDLTVEVANYELYQQMGVEKSYQLSQLRFNVTRNSQGTPVVLVSSRERITEPDLELVLNVKWPNGGFVRSYTVLLDPPTYTKAASQATPSHSANVAPVANNQATPADQSADAEDFGDNQAAPANQSADAEDFGDNQATPADQSADAEDFGDNQATPVDQSNNDAPAADDQPKPVDQSNNSAPAADDQATPVDQSNNAAPAVDDQPTQVNQSNHAAPVTAAQSAPVTKVWKVRANQTLSSIAASTRPNKKVSLDQAMLAIEGKNPQAFPHQNVNQLMLGSRLQIPSEQLMESIPQAKAEKEIAAQSFSWHHHQQTHHVLQPPYYSAKLAAVIQQPIATSVVSPENNNPKALTQASNTLPLVLQQTPLVEQQSEATANTPSSNKAIVLRAELSATVSEAQQMLQRNAQLQQQVEELQQQNHVLQQVMMAKLTSLDQTAQQLLQLQENKSAINTEQKPVVQRQAIAGQSVLLQNENSSYGWLSKLLLVLLLSGAVAGIWFTYRRKFFVLAALSSYLKPESEDTESVATESYTANKNDYAKSEVSSQKPVKAEPILREPIEFEQSSTELQSRNRSSVPHEFNAADDLASLVPDSDINTTKLELARAYVTMGDKVGAGKLIEEIMRDGTQQQRYLAKQLLNKL